MYERLLSSMAGPEAECLLPANCGRQRRMNERLLAGGGKLALSVCTWVIPVGTKLNEQTSAHGQRRPQRECLSVGLNGRFWQNSLDCWCGLSIGVRVSRSAEAVLLP
jgi:hypothetical protein